MEDLRPHVEQYADLQSVHCRADVELPEWAFTFEAPRAQLDHEFDATKVRQGGTPACQELSLVA